MPARKSINPDLEIARDFAKFYGDPLSFVKYAFPWGSGPLKDYKGPRKWQQKFLNDLGKEVKDRKFNGVDAVAPIRVSTVSGHGSGKSALSAWLILYIMCTRPFCKGKVTANTADQLKTMTWAELGKWYNLLICKHWFEYNNSKGNMNIYHRDHTTTWRCDAMTAREENSESFAGLHANNSTPFYLFDEASAIPEKIFEVAQGGLKDGEPMMFLFGNGTRNTGFFRDTHGEYIDRWKTYQIDTRKVEGTNKPLIKEWIEDHGEDSDFVRVRVRGMFPNASSLQFIPMDVIAKCKGYKAPEPTRNDPVIMSVDVAREGDDNSVVRWRHGRDCSSIRPEEITETDSIRFATIISELCRPSNRNLGKKPDIIVIDASGVGAGYYDQLKVLGLPLFAFRGGEMATNDACALMRDQAWYNAREQMRMGVSIHPEDKKLLRELQACEAGQDLKGRIRLEAKKEMKKRLGRSPDHADAFVMGFAFNFDHYKVSQEIQVRGNNQLKSRKRLQEILGG